MTAIATATPTATAMVCISFWRGGTSSFYHLHASLNKIEEDKKMKARKIYTHTTLD